MKYSIVYSSKTGNTAMLAQRLKDTLPKEDCVYYGSPDTKALEADFIFVGFWTDKGTCDDLSYEFLKSLKEKNVFLFGTAGYGGKLSYFTQILARTASNLDGSNTIAGTYMCQGRLPQSVKERYLAMLSDQPELLQTQLANYDQALSHPDEMDLEQLADSVRGVYS